jgi:hypothetical protein
MMLEVEFMPKSLEIHVRNLDAIKFQMAPRCFEYFFPNILLAACLALLIISILWSSESIAQRRLREPTLNPTNLAVSPIDNDGAEFYFARLFYTGNQYDRGYMGRGSWTTDWPEAEHFFIEGISRLTGIDTMAVTIEGQGGKIIQLEDGQINDYPFLYAVEVGYWSLNREEQQILRDYLLRGGFLMVDDFHGSQEWTGFTTVMQQVFPERPIVDIPAEDEIFHVLYDLDEKQQIPGLASLYNGITFERDGVLPQWRGIYDDRGRLMVMINHNMDLGDAWEHADTPGYPEPMTALAYRFAVNYVLYALTH